MNDFNELFSKLGKVARRAADTVSTEVSIAAQEQRIRESYQALGKLCYKANKEGQALGGAEFAEHYAKIDECLKRIEELREIKKVTVEPTAEAPAQSGDVTAEETDFVLVEE